MGSIAKGQESDLAQSPSTDGPHRHDRLQGHGEPKIDPKPLAIGPLRIWPPVVLAPMAGVTNAAFRSICRGFGAGLYVSEMATARGVVESWPRSERISHFGPGEAPRSIQLYGTDPSWVGRAVETLIADDRVDHNDLNFGCPVRKITRKGGGAALPYRRVLYRNIVKAAVDQACNVPITVKLRLGLSDDLLTFIEAGKIAEDEGASAITLHARTASQLYAGKADWPKIAELKALIRTIPVLGNGDIFEAHDAIGMMAATGCDGVVIGRGCLGRPWLFKDLADVMEGQKPAPPPRAGEVVDVMKAHLRLLIELKGSHTALRDFRKHAGWYLTGYAVQPTVRSMLFKATDLATFEAALDRLDPNLIIDPAACRAARGKSGKPQRVGMPEGFLALRDDPTPPGAAAEAWNTGG